MQFLVKLVYTALAAAMFYFVQGAISAGGFGFMYRYLFGMAIIALAAAVFLVKPNAARLINLAKSVLIMSAPYMVTVLWSAVIWIKEFAPLKTMTRGFFFPFYQIIAALTAAAILYMFSKKGIWYCLLGMCLGNGIIVALVVEEMVTLLTTFGEVTGAMMHETEVHDLTFGFGPFAVFLAMNIHPKNKNWWIACAAVGFFLLVGLKRIEIGAIAIAVVPCWLLMRAKDNTAKKIMNILCVVIIAASFA